MQEMELVARSHHIGSPRLYPSQRVKSRYYVELFCQLYVFISKGHNGAERYLEHSNASYW